MKMCGAASWAKNRQALSLALSLSISTLMLLHPLWHSQATLTCRGERIKWQWSKLQINSQRNVPYNVPLKAAIVITTNNNCNNKYLWTYSILDYENRTKLVECITCTSSSSEWTTTTTTTTTTAATRHRVREKSNLRIYSSNKYLKDEKHWMCSNLITLIK